MGVEWGPNSNDRLPWWAVVAAVVLTIAAMAAVNSRFDADRVMNPPAATQTTLCSQQSTYQWGDC